jgi:hypothetical protein
VREPIVVVLETEDGLYQEKWIFNWSGYDIVLQRYQHARREADSWVVTRMFDGEDTGTYGNWAWLREDQVPWDDDLKAEAALAVVAKLRVGRPSDFKKRRR